MLPNHSIVTICDYLKNSIIFQDNSYYIIKAFHNILELIFNNNIFKFKESIFVQKIGL